MLDARQSFDVYSACGVHIGDTTDYGYVVGLILNLPRLHSRNALAVAVGTSIANSLKRVPAELFDGVCDTFEEAKEMAYKVNVERDKARFARIAAKGPMGVLAARGR